jgi:hypothetical protein
MPDPTPRPWYRQFWPWFVMLPPAAAVVGGLITAWVAGGPPALVVDDYGEIAMATQQRAARDQRAAELGLGASLKLDGAPLAGPVAVTVELSASAADFEPPPALQLQLVDPTRPAMDRAVDLPAVAGAYRGQVDWGGGRTYVQLGDPDETWRLTGELARDGQRLELRPVARSPRRQHAFTAGRPWLMPAGASRRASMASRGVSAGRPAPRLPA